MIKDDIINYFNNLDEVKRIKELEHYIDNNEIIKSKKEELIKVQKQMVNAKVFKQTNQYKIYKEEYDKLYNELLDLPFVWEYLELLEYVNELLNDLTIDINKKLNKIINK